MRKPLNQSSTEPNVAANVFDPRSLFTSTTKALLLLSNTVGDVKDVIVEFRLIVIALDEGC